MLKIDLDSAFSKIGKLLYQRLLRTGRHKDDTVLLKDSAFEVCSQTLWVSSIRSGRFVDVMLLEEQNPGEE